MKEPSISLISALLLLGVVQNIILAFTLVGGRKRNTLADRILAGLLLVFSVSLIDGFLFETNYFFQYPHLIGLEWPVGFLYGPFAYFYIRALASPDSFAFRWNHLLHLIPFGMHVILLTPLYLITADEKIRLWELIISLMEKEPDFGGDPMLLVLVIQMAIYLVASLRLIAAYSIRLKQDFSSAGKINFTWLRDLFFAFFFLWCAFALASVYAPRYGVQRASVYCIQLMNAVVIFVMGIKGLRQPQIFARLDAHQEAGYIETGHTRASDATASFDEARTIGLNGEKNKYRKSSLSDEQSANILLLLTGVMETDRLFLEPELTLPELSKRLSLSPNRLSQVINGKLHKTFFDFVNEYRVEEAKKLLHSPEFSHFSILGVAMEVGFNSNSTFYSAFKKITGMTPSQYRVHRKSAEHSEKTAFPDRR